MECRRVASEARAVGDGRLLAEASLVVRGIGDYDTCAVLLDLCRDALRSVVEDAVLRSRLLERKESDPAPAKLLLLLIVFFLAAYIVYREHILPWYWETNLLEYGTQPMIRSGAADRARPAGAGAAHVGERGRHDRAWG